MLSLVLVPVVYKLVEKFELWLTPKLGRLVMPKAEGTSTAAAPQVAPSE